MDVDRPNNVQMSKKLFNANSQSDLKTLISDSVKSPTSKSIIDSQLKGKHQERRKSYNLISGVQLNDNYSTFKVSHARKTLLPP